MDIGPGDIVVFVNRDGCGGHDLLDPKTFRRFGVKSGRHYRVLQITQNPKWSCIGGLILAGINHPSPSGICAGCFRPLRKADPEFIETIARIPHRAPVEVDA